MMIKFWHTDLTEDSCQPWYSCHMELGTKPNGDPKVQVDRCFSHLQFWRFRLLLEALSDRP